MRPQSTDVSHDISKPTLLVPDTEGPHLLPLTTTSTTIPRVWPFGGINIVLVATSLTLSYSVAMYVKGELTVEVGKIIVS